MKSKIGQIGSTEDLRGTRDAVHVPVVLVETDDDAIKAGDNVRFVDSSYTVVTVCDKERRHAIVDPFLPDSWNMNDMFLVMLVPDAVTKLVHYYDLTFKDVEEENSDDGCRGCY